MIISFNIENKDFLTRHLYDLTPKWWWAEPSKCNAFWAFLIYGASTPRRTGQARRSQTAFRYVRFLQS